MKLLINTPDLNFLGGVANHYSGLRQYWTEDVVYNVVGRRSCCKIISGALLLPYDIIKFIVKLIFTRPDVVLLNPSLGDTALKRDFIFLKLAKLFKRKVAIFIHGFNLDYAGIVNKKWLVGNLNNASLIVILAECFKNLLRLWGVKVPIIQSTTKVADYLLEGFQIEQKVFRRNILFLARIEKSKGIYETIDTYVILKQEFTDLTLTIAGDGTELQNVKKYIQKNNIQDVAILGAISGNTLIEVYKNAGLYSFISYYEGLPTSVLEAMSFGLPIFTRNVGGLPDFFENNRMGYITDSLQSEDFANAMRPYLENKKLYKDVSNYNHRYAVEHFLASKVAIAIENELKQI